MTTTREEEKRWSELGHRRPANFVAIAARAATGPFALGTGLKVIQGSTTIGARARAIAFRTLNGLFPTMGTSDRRGRNAALTVWAFHERHTDSSSFTKASRHEYTWLNWGTGHSNSPGTHSIRRSFVRGSQVAWSNQRPRALNQSRCTWENEVAKVFPLTHDLRPFTLRLTRGDRCRLTMRTQTTICPVDFASNLHPPPQTVDRLRATNGTQDSSVCFSRLARGTRSFETLACDRFAAQNKDKFKFPGLRKHDV